MSKLHIANGLSLPTSLVTSTIVAYGGKGMGKTNLAAVLVEELAAAGLRWAWLDPLGVSWGLRHSIDGTGPGVECLILGGTRGDIPIFPEGGAGCADVVIDYDVNVLIDFSRKPSGEMWSVGEKIRFVTAYAHRLFQRQGELIGNRRREPLFQVLDEAARYIPQVSRAGDVEIAKCVGAWEQLVEEGRNIGLGVGLFTQRSARMAKSVSELADAIFAFRTVGPNSLGAILDWLGEHVDKAHAKELAEKVRALDRGSALVVSPGWLRFEGIVPIRLRKTFDSSATPKPGERAKTAKGHGARPDIVKISESMAASIEREKENDPKELKKKVAELQRELATAKKGTPPKVERVEVPVVTDDQLQSIEVSLKAYGASVDRIHDMHEAALSSSRVTIERIYSVILPLLNKQRRGGRAVEGAGPEPRSGATPRREFESRPLRQPVPVSSPQMRGQNQQSNGNIPPARQRILDSLAFLDSIGIRPADRTQLAFFAKQSPSSSAYANNLGGLRSSGLIDYPSGGSVVLTTEGAEHASVPDRPLTTDELHETVRSVLVPARWKIVEVLIGSYPAPVDRAELAEAAGQSASSSAYANNLGGLRTLGLLDYPAPGLVVAKPVLFLEGA